MILGSPELEHLIVAVGLAAARTVPLAWLVPAFGGPHVPSHIRVGLGLGLAMLCLPSLRGVPLPGAGPAQFGRVAGLTLAASAQMLEAALGLAAPAVVALLLADLAMGAIGQAAPQIPLYFVAMPLKALIGVGAMLIALGALDSAMTAGFGSWAVLLDRAVRAWRP